MPEDCLVRRDQEALAIKRANMEKAGVELVEPTAYVGMLFDNKYTPKGSVQ
jgi:hypothetical protein